MLGILSPGYKGNKNLDDYQSLSSVITENITCLRSTKQLNLSRMNKSSTMGGQIVL